VAVSTPTLTVTRHSTGRMVLLTVTGATGGASVTVYRWVGSGSGPRAWVRSAYAVGLTSGGAVMLDTEPPQGSVLVYQAVARDSAGATASSTQVTVSTACTFGGDYLFDLTAPLTGQVVNVTNFTEVTFDLRADEAKVIGRRGPVVVSDVRELATFQLEVATLTASDAEQLRASIYATTIMCLSPADPAYGISGPIYFVPRRVVESRPSALARQAARLWTIECQQVEPPTDLAVVTGAAASALFGSYTVTTPANVNAVYGWGQRSTATFKDAP
jgi:hypothetical protein